MKQILNKLDYEIHHWANSAMIKTEVTYYFHNPRESFKNFPRATDKKIKIDIDVPDDVDCLFWCNYFGFEAPMPDLVRFKNLCRHFQSSILRQMH
jgi:hypothetical protein